MFSARLVAYMPGGARLDDALLEGVSWDAQMPLNDVAALSLSYPSVADVMGLASEPVEIAVEVSTGGNWVEPRNARFLSSEISADLVQPLDVPQIKMRGLGALLERPMILRKSENAGKPYNSDDKRNFLSATAGQIITSIIQESRSRYATMLQGITLGFTASKDSLGNNWDKLDSVAYEPGTDLLRILEDMVARGICDWWMDGRVLHACNAEAGSTRRDTLTVPLLDASEAPVRITHEGRATDVAVEGGGGRVWEKPVPGAQVPYGAKILRIANDSVTTEGTANDLINRQIVQATGSRREYTVSLALIDFNPFTDFVVGDWLMAKSKSPLADPQGWESVRVHAVTLRWSAKDAALTGDLTLNDRFIDARIRDSKRLKGIAHGTTQNLGDGGVPSRADKAIPAAPTGVAANSLGYWQDVIPLSSVDVSWQAVTTDVDGLALNGVEAYEVRVGGQTKRVSSTSAGFDGLQPSRIYEVTVRAISTTGVAGRWSTRKEVLTAYPLEKLDPPTAPVLTSENGALAVDWDGKLQPASGNPYVPPKHFSHVLVEVQKVGSSTWTKYARDQGTVLVGLEAGGQWRVRLYAVDVLGNESAASAVSTITITSQAQQALARADEAAEEAQKAKSDALAAKERADDAFTGAPGSAAAQALTAANSKSRNWYGVNPPTREQGLAVGDSWFNGSRWQAALTVPESGDPTWRDMTPGEGYVDAVNIGRGTVGDLTVGRLSGVNSEWQYSAINTLVNDTAFIRDLLAQRIVVAPNNLVEDPGFVNAGLNAARTSLSSGAWSVAANNDDADMPRVFRVNQAGSGDVRLMLTNKYVTAWADALTPVTPGTRLRISASVRTYAGCTYGWVMYVRKSDGTTTTTGFRSEGAHPTTGRRNISYEWVVPSDVVELMVVFRVFAGTPVAYLAVGNIQVMPLVGTTLIEPNAITTPLIAAGTIIGDHMSVGALDAFRIRSPLFESVAAANRGIKWVGSEFVAWNNSGQEMFRLSGNTGEISGMTITGGVVRTAASGKRVSIGIASGGEPWLGIWDDNNNNRVSLTYNGETNGGGLYLHAADGTTRIAIVANGLLAAYAPNGKESFRVSTSNSGTDGQTWVYGPQYGSARTHIFMGNGNVDGVQTAKLEISGGTDADHSWMRVSNGGSWHLGSNNRGYIDLENSSGEISIYSRSSLLSFYNLPATTASGQWLTRIVSASGKPTVYRNTSLRAAKTNIVDLDSVLDVDRLFDLRPRVFHDKTAWEEYAKGLEAKQLRREGLTPGTGLEIWDGTAKPKPIIGLIAEEVVEIFPELASWDGDGSLSGVQYDRLPELVLAWLQKHWPALEARVEQLERQHNGNTVD